MSPARRRTLLLLLSAFVCGVLWFLYKGGGTVVSQSRGWGPAEDAPTHQLAWLFYRSEGWHFPPGRIADYPFGVGTSIGYTDGIPWLAMLAKLFSFALPAHVQYLGPWIAFCFGMQAVMGLVIARRLSSAPMVSVAMAGFLLSTQVLLVRFGHAALCGQWLLLAMIALHLRAATDGEAARRSLRAGLLVLVLACGTHVYLGAMALALYLALIARLAWVEPLIGPREALLALGGAAFGVLASFYLIGFFDGSQVAKNDFGEYSADLLTFVNPTHDFMLLPGYAVGDKQYEGFAYLGAGGLLLVASAGVSLLIERRERSALPWRRVAPLVTCCLLLALFALSHRVTVAGHPLFTLPPRWFRIFGVLHASGRFIWPLHYLMLVGAVVTLVRLHRARPRLLAGLLGVTLALQVVELRKLTIQAPSGLHELHAPEWDCARGRYRHLVMYPPQLTGCSQAYPWQYYLPLGFLAERLGMTFNSAYLGRNNPEREKRYCTSLQANIARGRLRKDSLYIVAPSALHELPQATCTTLEGFSVCRALSDPDCPLSGPDK